MELTQEPSWMDPIVLYLKTGEQPEDKSKACILRLKAACYVLYDTLWWQALQQRLPHVTLKSATPSEAKYIIRGIHEGTCANHARGQSLVFKALRQGYYWPTMKMDCMEYTRKCDKCQRFALLSKAHLKEITSMTSPWPFVVWGIDLIG